MCSYNHINLRSFVFLQELSQHKKILKNEVLELRKQLNTVTSERNKEKLETEKVKLELDSQKERNTWKDEQLKNYTKNFDNLMETMSLGSFASHQHAGSTPAAPPTRVVTERTGSSRGKEPHRPPRPMSKRIEHDETVDEDDDSDSQYSQYSRGGMSELTTEDISHACLSTKTPTSHPSDTHLYSNNHNPQVILESKLHYGGEESAHLSHQDSSPNLKVVSGYEETKSVSFGNRDTAIISDRSVQTSATQKLSVAQRSRLGANQPAPKRLIAPVPKTQKSGVFDKFGDKVSNFIDNSPLGVKVGPTSSPPSQVAPMSLKDRERRQRESQLNFLRKEGIIGENGDISVTSGSIDREKTSVMSTKS